MSPLRSAAVLPLLALAACATPQQRCIDAVTQEIRIIDQLIAQTKLNLDRGFGTRERTDVVPDWDWCDWPGGYVRDRYGNLRPAPPRMCWNDRVVTRPYAVAIDPAAEQRKLEALEARRRELAARVPSDIAQCRELNPR